MLSGRRNIKVCHFTSVHPVYDTRIFLKECSSLAMAGYETFLVATGCNGTVKNGVRIKGVPCLNGGRFKRFISTAWRTYKLAKSIDADIYHFHDPELLPYGLLLKKHGKKVIYDVHEDVPEDILIKDWMPKLIRRLVAICFEVFENWASKRMNYVIAATPSIYDRFLQIGSSVENINNYPIINELLLPRIENKKKIKAVCYVGAIDERRGIVEMVEAISRAKTSLMLAGEFSTISLREKVVKMSGWPRVKELGRLSRPEVAQLLSESAAGLVIFHPGPNYTNSQPNKMFEYMSAGLPIIVSNFSRWKEFVEKNKCGICVNPSDANEIANAIRWIINHPDEARIMGENGRKAVMEKYNWESESKKMLSIYHKLWHIRQ